MAYHTTAKQNEYNPSQLLMGWTFTLTIPNSLCSTAAKLNAAYRDGAESQNNIRRRILIAALETSNLLKRRNRLLKENVKECRRNRKGLIPMSVTAPTVNNRLPDKEPTPVSKILLCQELQDFCLASNDASYIT